MLNKLGLINDEYEFKTALFNYHVTRARSGIK